MRFAENSSDNIIERRSFNMDVTQLAMHTVEAMLAYGLKLSTAWGDYSRAFAPIIRMHELDGKKDFNRKIVTEYVHHVEERYENGEFTLAYYHLLKRGAQRLTEMHDTGKLEWTAPRKVSQYLLNPYYEKILAESVSGEDISRKAKSDMTWVGRKYFSWLIQEGHPTLRNVGADEIQQFMIFCSRHLKTGSVHDVRVYLKRLYRSLAANGHSKQDYNGLLSFKVQREQKIFPALSKEEIALTIDMIDRRTPKGKRDYSIILLGLVTGLRACDIIRLRLTDIDWKKGEIKIVQTKTQNSLALPLTRDVGEAIQDYILNGRRQSEHDAVFLTVQAPFKAFSSAVSIANMYDYYRNRAGLPRDAGDGKGFHALRRSLGKNMVTSGVPITLVAQVLGHEDINSTKQYISLDSEHLKECALDFSGIEPGDGVLA
jgi:integrase